MNGIISLDELLDFINSLSLDSRNKRWLGEKLIEEACKEEAEAIPSAGRFYGVWKDDDFPDMNADEMAKEIKASRKFKNHIEE